jgi:hypothetical protein
MEDTRRSALAMVALALGALACARYSDTRCNKANCDALVNCRLTIFVAPPCGSLPLGGETGAMLEDQGSQACIDICNAGGSGLLLQCVADNFPGDTCTDIQLDGGTIVTTVTDKCFQAPCGANCSSCVDQCNQTNATCTASCLKSATAGACISCSSACAQERARCGASCPTN